MFMLLNLACKDLYLPHRAAESDSIPYVSAIIPDLKYYFTVCLHLQE